MRRFPFHPDALSLDLTAMIDVIFLLLIFWMTVARLSGAAETEMVETPLSDAPIRQDVSKKVWTVTLTKAGDAVFIEEQRFALTEMRDLLSGGPPPEAVLLRADANTEAQRVQHVLSIFREAGISRVGLAVRGDAP